MKKTILILTTIISLISILSITLPIVLAGTEDIPYLDTTLLNQDPDPGNAGEYIDLRWKVIKKGNEKIEDISFTLDESYPFYFDKSDTPTKKLGNWAGYSEEDEYYILHYKLRVDKEAIEGTYDITLTTKNKYATVKKEYPIYIGEKKEVSFNIGEIKTKPTKLFSDTEENELEIALENIGDENAEFVKAELLLPDGFTPTYGYSDISNLGTIEKSTSKTAKFTFDIEKSLEAKEYETTLKVSYKEAQDKDNIYKTIELPIKIYLSGKPYFEIETTTITPEILEEGTTAKLKVKIKNIGTKEAESVSIKAFKESSQPFDFEEKTDFIGKLLPGKTGEGILTFLVEKGANPKNYLLDLEIRSIYNNEVLSDMEIIPIKISETTKKGPNLQTGIIITVGIIILGYIGYTTTKKK